MDTIPYGIGIYSRPYERLFVRNADSSPAPIGGLGVPKTHNCGRAKVTTRSAIPA